jgi:hypothetical protein
MDHQQGQSRIEGDFSNEKSEASNEIVLNVACGCGTAEYSITYKQWKMPEMLSKLLFLDKMLILGLHIENPIE